MVPLLGRIFRRFFNVDLAHALPSSDTIEQCSALHSFRWVARLPNGYVRQAVQIAPSLPATVSSKREYLNVWPETWPCGAAIFRIRELGDRG